MEQEEDKSVVLARLEKHLDLQEGLREKIKGLEEDAKMLTEAERAKKELGDVKVRLANEILANTEGKQPSFEAQYLSGSLNDAINLLKDWDHVTDCSSCSNTPLSQRAKEVKGNTKIFLAREQDWWERHGAK